MRFEFSVANCAILLFGIFVGAITGAIVFSLWAAIEAGALLR